MPEAARFIRTSDYSDSSFVVDNQKLLRWVRGGLVDRAIADVPGRDLMITFGDLVSLRIICALRHAGVSFTEIRTAEAWLRNSTGERWPFATERLWAGQGQVFTDFSNRVLSASRHGQLALDFLVNYLIPISGLTFDDSTRYADSWSPASEVLMRPTIQFGAPCVKGTRTPTSAIWGMVYAGDAIELVASGYGLSQRQVQAACDWETRLRAG